MLKQNIKIGLIFVAALFTLCACALRPSDIIIVDAKTALAVDESLMPIKVLDSFPKDTAKVSCWIKWRDSKINAQLYAKWHYVTDDIHILDYMLTIPKKEGMGSVTLAMPEGKKLPSGSYKIDLVCDNHLLRSLYFKVE